MSSATCYNSGQGHEYTIVQTEANHRIHTTVLQFT